MSQQIVGSFPFPTYVDETGSFQEVIPGALVTETSLNAYTLAAAVGSYAVTGSAATLSVQEPASTGNYAVTGSAASFSISEPAATGSYSVSGVAAGFSINEPATSGSYVISGVAVNFQISEPASTGSYLLSGSAASLTKGFGLAATAGSYTLTGVATNLLISEPATTGSYVLTGSSATLSISEPAASGAYAIAGSSVIFSINELAATGAYSLTGSAAGLFIGEPVAAGVYLLTGVSATLLKEAGLFGGVGSYLITGDLGGAGEGLGALGELALGEFPGFGKETTFLVEMPAAAGSYMVIGGTAALTVKKAAAANTLWSSAGGGSGGRWAAEALEEPNRASVHHVLWLESGKASVSGEATALLSGRGMLARSKRINCRGRDPALLKTSRMLVQEGGYVCTGAKAGRRLGDAEQEMERLIAIDNDFLLAA
jgi:hypothetical protein